MKKAPGAKLLDGKALAAKLTGALASRVSAVEERRGEAPLLAIVSIGGEPATEAYLRSKLQACKSIGIETTVQALPESTREHEAFQVIDDLAKDLNVDGILIELPLPPQLQARRLTERIPADKDVEGVTSLSYGRLFAARDFAEIESRSAFVPCTAAAIIALIADAGLELRGKEAVVVGRSNIVGKPVAHLLSCGNATVTLCHSKTVDLEGHLKRADIVVSAVGQSGLITGPMLKKGCAVFDAGMNFESRLPRGDVDFESASKTAGWITPVPGGVGPVTIASLLTNTVLAAERRTAARLKD